MFQFAVGQHPVSQFHMVIASVLSMKEPGHHPATLLISWDLFSLVLPVLALSPLLYLQAHFLWAKEHLQFYPLAFAATAWFLYNERTVVPRSYDNRRRRAIVAVTFAMGSCFVAVLFHSSWLAHMSLVLLIWAWALGRFIGTTTRRITAICALLIITIPAPLGWDQKLVTNLQWLSSVACSRFMDVTDILHIRSGNIIEIASQRLFVEEACSGVDSQYALMAVAGVMLLVGRVGYFVSIITVVTVPLWAILGNLLRIYTIVIGLEFLRLDLTTGLLHTVLGLCTFAIAASLHWSSVQFLNYLECACFTNTAERVTGNLCDGPASTFDYSYVSIRRRWFAVPGMLFLFTPFGLIGVYQFYVSVLDLPSIEAELAADFPSRSDTPALCNGSVLVGYVEEVRSRSDHQGQYSHTWNYRSDNADHIASLDLPFRGWHPLWECYRGSGWNRVSVQSIDDFSVNGQENFPYFESILQNDDGRFGVLHFSLFDEAGGPYLFKGMLDEKQKEFVVLPWLKSLAFEKRAIQEPLTFQFQLLSLTTNPPSELQILESRKLFLDLRKVVYRKYLTVIERLVPSSRKWRR